MNKQNRWFIVFGILGFIDVISANLLHWSDGLIGLIITIPFILLLGASWAILSPILSAIFAIGWIPSLIIAYMRRTKRPLTN